ncbi:MAG: penicillin acylase family protein [bacterium]
MRNRRLWLFVLLPALWGFGCSGDDDGESRSDPVELPPSVESLADPVEVFRDEWGIPHIYGSSRGEVLFMQGYEMARDRIFHMDHFRRYVYGTQAEVYGESFLADDVTKRVIGFRRLAEENLVFLEREHPEIVSFVQSYCNGVNAYIEDMKAGRNGAARPIEFDRIAPDYWPEPWQARDVVAVAKALVFSQSFQGPLELLISLAWWLLIPESDDLLRFQPLMPTYILEPFPTSDFDTVTVASAGPARAEALGAALAGADEGTRRRLAEVLLTLAGRLDQAFARSWLGKSGGSNNWVVDDSLTEGGACILCNDPHMPLEIPSTLMATHIVDLSVDQTGAIGNIAPGAPMVLIGHTAHLAWGLTNGFGDVTDLYREQLGADKRTVYFQGKWAPLDFFDETILVRPEGGLPQDAVPQTLTTRWVPHHGPIVNDLLPEEVGGILELFGLVFSARWPGFDSASTDLVCMKEVLDATTVEDGLQAMRYFNSGVLNWVFADTSGNIGYMAAGPYPVRANPVSEYPPYYPFTGSGSHEWQGYLDLASKPQLFNPSKGYVVTANNTIGDQTLDDDPVNDEDYWGHFFDLGARAWRITQRIEQMKAAGPIPLADLVELQDDDHLVLADVFLPYLLENQAAICAEPGADACRALGILEAWDRRCDRDSTGASIFNVWYTHFIYRTLQDDLPSLLLGMIGPYLPQIAGRNLGAWLDGRGPASGKNFFDDKTTPAEETAGDQMTAALQDALAQLAAFFGPERAMESWRWGEIHLKKFHHPVWDDFSLGPFENDGGLHTVDPAEYSMARSDGSIQSLPYEHGNEGPAFRLCVEMKADEWTTYNVLPGGESSHWGDPHYGDQMPLYLANDSFRFWYLREEVEEHAAGYRLYPQGFPETPLTE